MKCDTCRNKDRFDECVWPQLGCCNNCICNTCQVCEKPVKAMVKLQELAAKSNE